MMFYQKRKLNILLLILFFGIFISGCSFGRNDIFKNNKSQIKSSQKSNAKSIVWKNDLKNWKVYHDEEYGFEFKYPKTWILNKETENDIVYFKLNNPKTPFFVENLKEDAVSIMLIPKNNPNFLSANKVLAKWKKEYDIQIKEINISNNKAFYYRGFARGVLIPNIQNKDYELSITSNISNNDFAKINNIFNQIVYSFDFFD